MAKNDLGFEQEEFQSLSDNPFERADQAPSEPGEELGALEVAQTRAPRSFRNQQAILEAQQSQYQTPKDTASEVAQEQQAVIAQQNQLVQEQELLEQQFLEQQEAAMVRAESEERSMRERNTNRAFLWGSFAILFFPPVGMAMLKYPILVQRLEQGSAGIPLPKAQKLMGKFAPYPPGKRIIAEFLIWSVPTIWGVLATALAIILVAYIAIISICTFSNSAAQALFGSACFSYFGIPQNLLQ